MMARRGAIGLLAGGVAAVLGGCSLFGNRGYRFKMTVEVETPEGLRSGSSVYEVETVNTTDLVAGGKGSRFDYSGEAVAVDLPDGRTLFALLKTVAMSGHDNVVVSSMVAMDPAFDYDWMASTSRIAAREGIRSPAEVPAEYYPMLVVFGDINDPTTVEQVAPTSIGVKRIIVQVADEPVTTGIEERLRWLGASPDPRLDNDFKPTPAPTLAQKLKYGDFRRGQ